MYICTFCTYDMYKKKQPRKVYSFILKNWQWVFYEAPSPNEIAGDRLYMHILKNPRVIMIPLVLKFILIPFQ